MIIRQAMGTDFQEVRRIFVSAKETLREMGIDQWQHPGVPNPDTFADSIESGHGWVVAENWQDNALYGFMVLNKGPETVYEDMEESCWSHPEAPYLAAHRVAADPACAGRGVGRFMMRFAQHQAYLLNQMLMEENGGQPVAQSEQWHVRLDTHPGNKRMMAIMEKLGFTYGGIAIYDIPGERRRICYEGEARPLSVSDAAKAPRYSVIR